MNAGVSPLILLCLGFLTALCVIAVPQLIRMWRHETIFFDVGRGSHLRYRRARVRALPAAAVGVAPILLAGWLFAINPPTMNTAPNGFQVATAIFGAMAAVDILVIVPAIVLFNVPKRFVPPHLRNQPGFLKDYRSDDHTDADGGTG
jgi:hypothetical protein